MPCTFWLSSVMAGGSPDTLGPQILPQSPFAADAGGIDPSRRPARTSDAVGKRAPATSSKQYAAVSATMIHGNLRMPRIVCRNQDAIDIFAIQDLAIIIMNV